MNSRNSISFIKFYGAAKVLVKDKSVDVNDPVIYYFDNQPSVKDAIESLGPPHTEVIAILVNSKPKKFDYLLQDEDNIEVFSFDTKPDIPVKSLLPNQPKGKANFVLDVHLGGLARYLRFLGFDTLYEKVDRGDNILADQAKELDRVLLTRDIGLLKHAKIRYGYWLRNTQPEKQLLEVALRYNLKPFIKPFSRCSVCNGLIKTIGKNELKARVSMSIYHQFDEFWECENCHHIYWKGEQYFALKKQLDDLANQISY